LIDAYALSEEAFAELLGELGQPKYRAKQIRAWLYDKGAVSFQEMTDLPKPLRDVLEERVALGTIAVDTEQVSKDGTRKRLYRLHDGQLVEAVLMAYEDGRRTACISSQAGCGMGCTFCATGQMGFARQLTSTEIFEQAALFARELTAGGERLSNVVLMGMGEPFANYDAVLEAIRRMNRELGIGARHITVSTVGLVPKIRQLVDEGIQVTLAVSLHAATDEERSKIMPVNRRYPLAELIAACHEYVAKGGRRVTFEWALIAGKNDTPEVAERLGGLLQGLQCHVNLIPLNPTAGYAEKPSSEADARRFVEVLGTFGIPATVRVRRGIDIDAGCGQLKAAVLRKAAVPPTKEA
jgi:23S rRNA (adenine2503-C2)-methyltransferase